MHLLGMMDRFVKPSVTSSSPVPSPPSAMISKFFVCYQFTERIAMEI